MLATTIALLCGCGWQLRDAQVVPSTSVGSVHVATQLADREIVSELTRRIKRLWRRGGRLQQRQADYSVSDCRLPRNPPYWHP